MIQREKVKHITSVASLEKLAKNRLKIFPGSDQIRLELGEFTSEENKIWAEKIEDAYNECGCKKGERFTYWGASLAAAYIVVCFTVFEAILPRDYAITLSLILGFAATGKAIGLQERKKRLQQIVTTIKSNLHQK